MGLLDETHSIFRCIEMKTTLEQWQLLQAVVELGSYNKAAEQFHRTQSSVSYQLGILQERLGIPLLTIVGRKAELTEAGHDLLAQAAVLLEGMHALEARAEAILQGERTHIHLVVDSIFPKTMLFSVLEKFHQQHPQTQVHLTEILRSESLRQLAKHTGDLYLIHLPTVAQHQGKLLLEIGFVAVACRDHALLHKPQPLHERDLAQYPVIKIVDRQTQKHPEQATATAEHWSFTSVDAAIEAIRHGVGYGWVPENQILSLLAEGVLVPLPLQSGGRRSTPLYLVEDAPLEQDATLATLIQLLGHFADTPGVV
jgi:DNA-binding transcriptional LysR family regulator